MPHPSMLCNRAGAIQSRWVSVCSQDLTDAAGRKAAADLLDVLLRAPETFHCGASDDRLMAALAELAKKVLLRPLYPSQHNCMIVLANDMDS